MYIYNVTMNVAEEIHEEWLKWMKEEHLPEMLATKKFTKARLSRVMVQEPMGGITYSAQYETADKNQLEAYYQEDAEDLRKESRRFKDKMVSFRTEMEVIEEQS